MDLRILCFNEQMRSDRRFLAGTYLLCFIIWKPSLKRRQQTLVCKPRPPILAVGASTQCLVETMKEWIVFNDCVRKRCYGPAL